MVPVPASATESITRQTRIDAHCHSSASSGAANEALAWINCPECYSPPERVYELARARGMDLFTLTDHDTIAGGLSLLERGFPGVILGEEVTVHFPEDRCKLHVLVWGLSPAQHEAFGTLGLRDDVYAFAQFLREQNLPHALAHPLYVQNRKLSAWHLERAALLFKGFEVLNGAHSGSHRSGVEAFLRSLTPGRVHRLIEQHGLEPLWPRVWEKARTGGSDDHGLLNVGRTWTCVTLRPDDPRADAASGKVLDPREFFRLVMGGAGEAGGDAGNSSLLAHQLCTVAAHFFADRWAPKSTPAAQHVASKFLRFAGVRVPQPSRLRLGWHALKRRLSRRRRTLGPLADALRESFGPVLAKYPDLAARLAADSGSAAIAEHERFAHFADDLYGAVHTLMASSAVRAWGARDRRDLLDHVAAYLVLELTQVPYIFSLFHQNKERPFVEQLEHDSKQPGVSALDRPMRVLLFTDTLGDVNGVSRFIRNAADQAAATGRDLRVVTSTNFEVPSQDNIINIKPAFATRMPKYENLELALPPIVPILRLADRHQPDIIHISTPGPVGVAGFIAARMLKVPVLGVYHTDFPAYVERLFANESLTYFCTEFMKLFYGPFASIFTRSHDYARSLVRLGMDHRRIVPLMPGLCVDQFHPRFRDEALMQRLGSPPGTVRVLYVGRVSVEKNLPLLSAAWKEADRRLRQAGVSAELVVVGDGPYREEMERDLRHARVRFLGFRYGEELSRVYASCDMFVFPSVTDTLGQVVMESQASGMPVIVSDQGGPKEVVDDGRTGLVLPAGDAKPWAEAIARLAADEGRRAGMGARAHEFMQEFSMDRSFEHFWQVHERVWVESLARRTITPRSREQAARGAVTTTYGVGRSEREDPGVVVSSK